jgi:hypothetical protein
VEQHLLLRNRLIFEGRPYSFPLKLSQRPPSLAKGDVSRHSERPELVDLIRHSQGTMSQPNDRAILEATLHS